MREIKFRAYYKADKRIYEVLYLDFASNELGLWDEETEFDFECSFEDVELMQYTDCKDKNGREIYEGDIVKKSNGAIGQVVYLKATAGYKPYNNGQVFDLFEADARYLEVVGNIYENPEILQ